MDLETSITSEGLVTNSTLLLLQILAAAIREKAQLKEELQKAKDKVETLESFLQNNRLHVRHPMNDSLVSQLVNISAVLQNRVEDVKNLHQCEQKLMESTYLIKSLPTALNGRQMKDAALECSKTGNIEQLRILLSAGAGVDTTDDAGRSLLLWASNNGHVQTARMLLDRGATIDQISPGWFHNTPMMAAAWNGYFEVVKLLLERGGKLEYSNESGGTELHHAAITGRLPIVKLLIENGANIHAKMNDGKNVLQVAKANVADWLATRVN